jgi:Ni/Co efflux regulator RcnB
MRNIMAGFAVLGSLAVGVGASAATHTMAPLAVVQPTAVQQADWDNCGPRCQDHRREAREREEQRQRWAQHHQWEEHHRWEEGNRYPSRPQPYSYQYH